MAKILNLDVDPPTVGVMWLRFLPSFYTSGQPKMFPKERQRGTCNDCIYFLKFSLYNGETCVQ